MLFESAIRTDDSPKRATETDFQFIDRSSRPEIQNVRIILNDFFSNYPPEEQAELKARIESGDVRHFRSGTFELILHEYFLRLGVSVELHPALNNGSNKRPDFLLTFAAGEQLYVEAVCASENTGEDTSAESRKDVALELLNSRFHPDFYVCVSSKGDPVSQPSGKKLGNDVIAWLNTLDANLVSAMLATNPEAHPKLSWKHEAWDVEIKAVPISPERRGLPHPLIGLRSFGGNWLDGWTPIREAILKKTARYGKLDLPLVVAVNLDTFRLDQIDISQALFGQEQLILSASEPRMVRAPNGAWHQPTSRGERCGGAWIFGNLLPYTLARSEGKLFLNPSAHLHVPEGCLCVPHMLVIDDSLQEVNGVTLREAFELNESWPE